MVCGSDTALSSIYLLGYLQPSPGPPAAVCGSDTTLSFIYILGHHQPSPGLSAVVCGCVTALYFIYLFGHHQPSPGPPAVVCGSDTGTMAANVRNGSREREARGDKMLSVPAQWTEHRAYIMGMLTGAASYIRDPAMRDGDHSDLAAWMASGTWSPGQGYLHS